MKTNQEYKNAALSRLRGNWAPVIVGTIIFLVVDLVLVGWNELPTFMAPNNGLSALVSGAGILLTYFVFGPLNIGYANACRVLLETGDTDLTPNILVFSTSNYFHKVAGYFLMIVKIALWSCLLIIPGIVMSFAYAMTPYVLEENPELSAWEASARSREMMKGHKFDLFYLYLSFIGWFILSLLTCGIGLIWLMPYTHTSVAAFYNDLKGGDGNPAIVVG